MEENQNLVYRDNFDSLVNQQFAYGGSKYAGDSANPQKEATDHLVDDFTYLWLIGTFAKYAKRFKNTNRERDLLKTACYMYITWLKRGYHINYSGTTEIIDTNVTTKTKFYSVFLDTVHRSRITGTDDILKIYDKFKDMVDRHLNSDLSENLVGVSVRRLVQYGFNRISEEDLIYIYKSCYLIWFNNFKDVGGKDADTYNEGKNDKPDLGVTETRV